MSVSRVLLLALVSLLLCASLTAAFNPYADDDDSGVGEAPKTSTVTCTKNAAGEEVCESVAKIVPGEAELEAKVAAAEAERAEAAEKKAAERRERQAALDAARAAKRAEKQKSKDAEKEKQEQQKSHQELYDKSKLADPIKKLKVSYYKFFGVEENAPKLKIRKVANNMALANHPDKCPDREDMKCINQRKEVMIVLNEAREVLLNDEKREKYDFLLNFGFKVYDEELYQDVLERYKNGEDIEDGWDSSRGYDPATDPFESMDLTEESAGWLLLITGSVTLALMAWPVMKFWQNSLSDEKKKELQKKGLAESLRQGRAVQASLKKKTEKFSGERAKKDEPPSPAPVAASPASAKKAAPAASKSPAASPKAAAAKPAAAAAAPAATAAPAESVGPSTTAAAEASPAVGASTTSVALLCLIALLAFSSPAGVTASSPLQVSYYDLLEVSTSADAGQLKRAYRSAALKWHPDRFVDRVSEQEEASAKFVLIAEGQKNDHIQ